MAEHLTEEEQIETIKRWWSENWSSIVLPIVVAAMAYTGWNFWTGHQGEQLFQSSNKYQALVTLMSEAPEGDMSEDMRAQVRSLGEEILDVNTDGAYADFTRLILAKVAYDAGNHDTAEEALVEVQKRGATDAVKQIATARLAKLLIDKGEVDRALSLVSNSVSKTSKALYAEVRGDAYAAKGELEAANTAYKEALDALEPQNRSQSGVLQLKLQATATPTVASAPASDAAEASPAAITPDESDLPQ